MDRKIFNAFADDMLVEGVWEKARKLGTVYEYLRIRKDCFGNLIQRDQSMGVP